MELVAVRRTAPLQRVAAGLVLVCAAGGASIGAPAVAAPDSPNILIVLADDLGFGDLGHNGSPIATPHIDALARQGVRLTDFHASSNVCTPSRAGLMTGRYAIRMGLAHKALTVGSEHGLPPAETTLAEILENAGYRTALVGKWHLGDRPQYWPTEHGFQHFFGVLHSNDMQPFVLYRGRDAVEQPVDQTRLTERYTAEAVAFVEAHAAERWFLFVSHTFPHYPPFAGEAYAGRSAAGRYGDAVEELDASVGRVLDAVDATGGRERTLVLFTSDNGSWFEGSNAGARGGKGESYSGGYRVPLIARWPGRLPAGAVSTGLAMNIDLMPTISGLVGIELPDEIELDGRDIRPLLEGGNDSPHGALLLFNNEDVAAIRTPRWKYLVRGYYRDNYVAFDRFEQGFGFAYPLLFDMQADPGERYSVADRHPEVVAALERRLDAARREFGPMRTVPAAAVVP